MESGARGGIGGPMPRRSRIHYPQSVKPPPLYGAGLADQCPPERVWARLVCVMRVEGRDAESLARAVAQALWIGSTGHGFARQQSTGDQLERIGRALEFLEVWDEAWNVDVTRAD
jgi:hypothetical protein